jgi:hypothetical protein
MEAEGSSETLLKIYQITGIPEYLKFSREKNIR